MKAWKHIGIFLVAALVACSCGVSKVKDITLTSVGIQYIVPTSARSMDAKLELGINNPAMGFAVQEVTGTVRYNEKELAHFMTGPLQLEGKSEQVYELPCTVTLAEGAAYWDLYAVMGGKNSMSQWVRHGYAGPDYVLFTPAGAKIVGETLSRSLLTCHDFSDLRKTLPADAVEQSFAR